MRVKRALFNYLLLAVFLSTSSLIHSFSLRALREQIVWTLRSLPSTTVRQGLVCSGPLLLTAGAYCKGHKTKTGKIAGGTLCILGSTITPLGWSIARYDGILNSLLDDVYLTNPAHLAYLSIGAIVASYATYRLAKLIKTKLSNKRPPDDDP